MINMLFDKNMLYYNTGWLQVTLIGAVEHCGCFKVHMTNSDFSYYSCVIFPCAIENGSILMIRKIVIKMIYKFPELQNSLAILNEIHVLLGKFQN